MAEYQVEGLSEPTVFLTENSDLQRLLAMVCEKMAPSDEPVLITGETGTGKELVAHLVHQHSSRATKPLEIVNCPAIPHDLLESTLFGHKKGAFSGADLEAIGRFQLADGGTIFLDELGELSLAHQAKLLRVLNDGTIDIVGGRETIKVDVRVVCATNRRIDERIQEGHFREDLLYRLGVLHVDLPPLRNHPEDIPLIAKQFVAKLSERYSFESSLSDEAVEKLCGYLWPGNVRELMNVIRRAVILNQEGEIEASMLEFDPILGASSEENNHLEDAVMVLLGMLIEKHPDWSVQQYAERMMVDSLWLAKTAISRGIEFPSS